MHQCARFRIVDADRKDDLIPAELNLGVDAPQRWQPQVQTGLPALRSLLVVLSVTFPVLLDLPAHFLSGPDLALPGEMLGGQCFQLVLDDSLRLRGNELLGALRLSRFFSRAAGCVHLHES